MVTAENSVPVRASMRFCSSQTQSRCSMCDSRLEIGLEANFKRTMPPLQQGKLSLNFACIATDTGSINREYTPPFTDPAPLGLHPPERLNAGRHTSLA
jgi:hypothetical protein